MGRNIFQSSAPRAMLKTGGEKVVHENLSAREAYQFWQGKTGRAAMNVTLVEINIKPERVDEFLEVFRANHEGALQEPGNLALMSCRTRR